MYRKIIVGYDGRPVSEDALAFGKLIANATGAHLMVATVVPFDPISGGQDPAFRDLEAIASAITSGVAVSKSILRPAP